MSKNVKIGCFSIFDDSLDPKYKKTGFARARVFAIPEFWGVIEENRLRDRKLAQNNAWSSWYHHHHHKYIFFSYN